MNRFLEGMRRKNKFVLIILCSLLFNSCLIHFIAVASSRNPEDIGTGLSKGAIALIDKAYEGINPELLTDYHTHIVGINQEKTGSFVNERMLKWWHLKEYLRFRVYKSSLRITDLDNADEEIVKRLVSLIRSNKRHGK
ncbi:MAG: hypothetical protein K8R21_11250, partial [Leptospira sp.]|nr:hypothetical protein [Leptospira sp.]